MKSKIKNYFSKCEIYLWCISVFFIVISFIAFDRQNYIAFFASIIGVTSLIYGFLNWQKIRKVQSDFENA